MNGIDELLRANLTEEQYRAATSDAKEILCLACAGSGKSRTMAFRAVWLLANGAPPESIVAFTFTEKAADVIRRRIVSALKAVGYDPIQVGLMYIGTIHAFCQRLLVKIDVKYRQYDVLDGNRLKLFLISRYRDLDLEAICKKRGAKYNETIREVARAWQTANDEMLDYNRIAAADPEMGEVLRSIRGLMERERFLDFSLMVREAVDAVRGNRPGVADALKDLRHFLVDEYQDVNPAQEELIRLLHAYNPEGTLFVVGDDDQAIYEWRGADVSNILKFTERYPQADRHALSVNFRSTGAIVSASGRFIHEELGPARLPKEPRADEKNAAPTPRDFRVLWFEDREREAEWVAERVRTLLGTAYQDEDGTRGLTPADFAVLMRSTRSEEGNGRPRHAAFTKALGNRGIPYSLEAGGSPFDRPQVQVLRRVFALLRDGVPSRPETLNFFNNTVKSAYPHANPDLFVDVISRWGGNIHRPVGAGLSRVRLYPQRFLHEILEAFGIDRTGFGDDVMREIGLFSRMMLDVESVYISIDSSSRFREIINFLENIAESGYDVTTDDLVQRPDAVTVSTVHKAKGLEFPCVFVVDTEHERFPCRQHKYDGWLPEKVMQPAIDRQAYRTTHAGEARLFYTAITRAERYLYVTGAQRLPGGKKNWKPSVYAKRLEEAAKQPELAAEINTSPDAPLHGLVPATPRRRTAETDYPTTFSEVRYYLRCPKDYQFRYRYGFSPEVPAMFGYGQTVHTIIERLHKLCPDRIPTETEIDRVVEDTFHLKHIYQSRSGEEGPYEKARASASEIAQKYVETYRNDFLRSRSVEVTFEIPAQNSVISGAIDLILKEDEEGRIREAEIVDFKTLESGGEEIEWTEMSLQVQLYARAAIQLLGENAKTGWVHFLKDGRRVEVPIDDASLDAALENIEWAVRGILEGDFPMRPEAGKCENCDFRRLCAQRPETFRRADVPPDVSTPDGPMAVPAFRLYDPSYRKA